ncbi:hypothetical protein Tco_0616826, partial [Tanacetum coccineum]
YFTLITYTFVSSGSNEPSAWGIPLVNAGEIPNVDPYEDLPAAEDTELHGVLADSDSMEDDTDTDSIDYPD